MRRRRKTEHSVTPVVITICAQCGWAELFLRIAHLKRIALYSKHLYIFTYMLKNNNNKDKLKYGSHIARKAVVMRREQSPMRSMVYQNLEDSFTFRRKKGGGDGNQKVVRTHFHIVHYDYMRNYTRPQSRVPFVMHTFFDSSISCCSLCLILSLLFSMKREGSDQMIAET